MILQIISIVLNIVFCIVLNLNLYTDSAMMPTGQMRYWKRSPLTRLNIMGRHEFAYVQFAFAALSAVTAIMIIAGVKSSLVRKIWIAGTLASTAVFIIIMVMTSNSHAKYG
jgi:hypothetical protein